MSESKVPIHRRSIQVDAFESGPNELTVEGNLVDERPQGGPAWFGGEGPRVIHDMRVALTVRFPELTIVRAEGAMTAHPYGVCPEAVPPLQGLIGVSVAQGFTRAVNERFGRQLGCAHLTALIQAMAPVVRQAAGAAFVEKKGAPPMPGDRWFINTCQAWREGGPLHTLLETGDVAGLRAAQTPGFLGRPSPGE